MGETKTRLHARNRNRESYDITALVKVQPELKTHLKPNKRGEDSINFSDPEAVKVLNKALLNHYYGIKDWDFPDENLCPPIPGRADYIHHIADLLSETNQGQMPKKSITCLDVGVGASCIYPILGATEYGWKFIGSDIDKKSLESAQKIVDANTSLTDKIELRHQKLPGNIFNGIINVGDKIDISICNPPFHSSLEEAKKGTERKVKNLSGERIKNPQLNFSGIPSELICEGGEYRFIQNMIRESVAVSKNCLWFSTIVSKHSHLKGIYKSLDKHKVSTVKTILTGTGNKSSRVVAWTFMSELEQREWSITRWV